MQSSFKLPRSLLLVLILTFLSPGATAAEVSKEYQLKAVFLFHFAQFVEWPTNAFTTPESPITLGVLGTNPFDNALQETVRGERVSGRSLVIKQFQRVEEIDLCHVLFISRSETAQLASVLGGLRDRSILTVSDSEAFNVKGGMIQFITEANRIRFKINRKATEAANLRLSSQLLRLAEVK